MAKTIIHVNQHNIKFNRKQGENIKPVLTVKSGKNNLYCNEVTINGPSKVVYQPDNPLSCGAHVWIETTSEVLCKDPMTFQDTKRILPNTEESLTK